MDRTRRAELARLHAAGTPGLLERTGDCSVRQHDSGAMVATTVDYDNSNRTAFADLIVGTNNTLPELLAYVDVLEARCELAERVADAAREEADAMAATLEFGDDESPENESPENESPESESPEREAATVRFTKARFELMASLSARAARTAKAGT